MSQVHDKPLPQLRYSRTLVNIEKGRWTPEDEYHFRVNADNLIPFNPAISSFIKPIDWPDGRVW